MGQSVNAPSPLIGKALADAGYDIVESAGNGWLRASISGNVPGVVWVRTVDAGTLLAVDIVGVVERIGLVPSTQTCIGASSVGLATSSRELFAALRLLRALVTQPASRLSEEVEARLAKIPATERTQEVRARIGQEVYREALLAFWNGQCSLSGAVLPRVLLRASHAKPWKDATDAERLDPFNGLLLAVRYDALFDKGLIAFSDDGLLLVSTVLTPEVRQFVGLHDGMRLRFVVPGHLAYLRYHREHVARL